MEQNTKIRELALANGFELFGVARASAPPASLNHLSTWLSRGLHGTKEYFRRQLAKRLDPSLIFPGVRSILCLGILYNTDKPYSVECRIGSGENSTLQPWISRYAWGRDYHEVVGGKLKKVEEGIRQDYPGSNTLSFCDSGPVSEKAWAAAAGLGWQGKNSVLINPKLGSWLFLGVILTDLELEPGAPAPDHCGTCRLCLEACPTGALVEPYVLDVSKCVSNLNFLKNELTARQASALGANLLGCDICQDVCPFNRSKKTTAEPAFQCGPENWRPDLERLQGISDADFKQVYRDSYVGRLRPELLRRNARIVKGNLNADHL